MNYRKLYAKENGVIPKDWEIHHIDFNHNNNEINNLISLPKIVHVVIHQTGYLNRSEINKLINTYNKNVKTN